MDRLLNFILSIESLRPRRSDDEFTAAWKDKQREVLMSVLLMVVTLIAGFVASTVLKSFFSIPVLAGAVDMLRDPTAYVLLAAMAFFFLRMCLAFWDLFRFTKRHGME